MKLAALCDEDTAVGLQLAGIKETYVPKDDSAKIWKELSERDDIGIIFITEQIVEDLQRELKDFRLQNNIPIILLKKTISNADISLLSILVSAPFSAATNALSNINNAPLSILFIISYL